MTAETLCRLLAGEMDTKLRMVWDGTGWDRMGATKMEVSSSLYSDENERKLVQAFV